MAGNCSPSEVIFKPRNRQANLNERRRLKMARSAHAYVRGSTVKFYERSGWRTSAMQALAAQNLSTPNFRRRTSATQSSLPNSFGHYSQARSCPEPISVVQTLGQTSAARTLVAQTSKAQRPWKRILVVRTSGVLTSEGQHSSPLLLSLRRRSIVPKGISLQPCQTS